jgi:hypothetical protein
MKANSPSRPSNEGRCENVRLEELKEGLGGWPLRILRVNPTDSEL